MFGQCHWWKWQGSLSQRCSHSFFQFETGLILELKFGLHQIKTHSYIHAETWQLDESLPNEIGLPSICQNENWDTSDNQMIFVLCLHFFITNSLHLKLFDGIRLIFLRLIATIVLVHCAVALLDLASGWNWLHGVIMNWLCHCLNLCGCMAFLLSNYCSNVTLLSSSVSLLFIRKMLFCLGAVKALTFKLACLFCFILLCFALALGQFDCICGYVSVILGNIVRCWSKVVITSF